MKVKEDQENAAGLFVVLCLQEHIAINVCTPWKYGFNFVLEIGEEMCCQHVFIPVKHLLISGVYRHSMQFAFNSFKFNFILP